MHNFIHFWISNLCKWVKIFTYNLKWNFKFFLNEFQINGDEKKNKFCLCRLWTLEILKQLLKRHNKMGEWKSFFLFASWKRVQQNLLANCNTFSWDWARVVQKLCQNKSKLDRFRQSPLDFSLNNTLNKKKIPETTKKNQYKKCN